MKCNHNFLFLVSAKLKAAMPSALTSSLNVAKSTEGDKAEVAKAAKAKSVKAEKKESKVVSAEDKKEVGKPAKRRVVKSAEFNDSAEDKKIKSKRVAETKFTKLEEEEGGKKAAVLAALQRINELNVIVFLL